MERGAGDQSWFHLEELEPGIIVIEEPWHEERVKTYLVIGESRAMLLDAGTGVGPLRRVVEDLTTLPITLVLSHAHWDHIGSAHTFAGDCEILIHPLAADELREGVSNQRMRRYLAPDTLSGPYAGHDLCSTASIPGVEPTGFLEHGQIIDLGGRTFNLLHTPGHTAGLVVLWDAANAVLFGTDAVYAGALYAHMADSSLEAYVSSLDMLSTLDPSPRAVYAAHDESPVPPALIPVMRDAMIEVRGGRAPDAVERETAVHDFSEFSILAPTPSVFGPRR